MISFSNGLKTYFKKNQLKILKDKLVFHL